MIRRVRTVLARSRRLVHRTARGARRYELRDRAERAEEQRRYPRAPAECGDRREDLSECRAHGSRARRLASRGGLQARPASERSEGGQGRQRPQNEPQELTITGGTGRFSGASGRGTVQQRSIGGGTGVETWTGTLEVPGLTFDLTPPRLSGATSRTVRAPKGAKNARVTYKVTATDDVDGSLPVSCQPRSGSRFKVGRTTVRCQATDSSANTAKAAFAITVRKRR